MNTAMQTRPDTRDMVVVHRVFRRELRLLGDYVRLTPVADLARARRVTDWARIVLDLLHHHHHGEDEAIWPLLHERAPLDTPLVQRMEDQHAQVAALLDEIQGPMHRYAATAGSASRAELVFVLGRLSGLTDEHLADEERLVLPLVEAHLSAAEYAGLGARARAGVTPEAFPFVFGAILEEADAEERAMMTAPMPAHVVQALDVEGLPRYRRFIADLRAGR